MLLECPAIEGAERTCSDCGRPTVRPTRAVDLHTHSEVQLCPDCLPAFEQRQHMPPGCCGA